MGFGYVEVGTVREHVQIMGEHKQLVTNCIARINDARTGALWHQAVAAVVGSHKRVKRLGGDVSWSNLGPRHSAKALRPPSKSQKLVREKAADNVEQLTAKMPGGGVMYGAMHSILASIRP